MSLMDVAMELRKAALAQDDDEVSAAMLERADRLVEQAEAGDTLTRLLGALQGYEDICEPGALPRVVLFSDGSGLIATSDAGDITDFSTPAQAAEWLESATKTAE